MIDYTKIAMAVEYYKALGYKYIDAPWLVSKDTIDITKPPELRYFSTAFGHLVGSGEQSFLHIRNHLKVGKKYQCVTPCFRDDVKDEFHQRCFLKLELIEVLGEDEANDIVVLEKMINDAWDFFAKFANEEDMEEIDYGDNFDIEVNGVEVGSYGARSHQGFSWAYGTGVAEPRFSIALKN